MANRAFLTEWLGRFGYVGVALYTYQLTLGLSLRWYEGQPHFRFYFGPLKFFAGLFLRPGQPVFSGGDR